MTGTEGSLHAPRLMGMLDALLGEAPVSGGAIAFGYGGTTERIVFGTAGPTSAPVELSDRFEIGSISKTVAALAAARLEIDGAWTLDDPVRLHLPWLPLPSGAGEPTLRHLLSHTAGWIAGNSAAPGEIAQALALSESRAITAPGARFHYSNIGFVVLGLAAARAAGMPFADYLRTRVLEPLGLPGALTSITGAERALLCPGTVPCRDDAQWEPGAPLREAPWVEPAGADGNIAATVDELLRFGRALTDPHGVGDAAPWLPAAVQLITAPTAPSGEDILELGTHLPVRESRYGLGVNVERTDDGPLFTHGGGMVGYGSFLLAHPWRDIAVSVVLSAPGEYPYAELLAREAHAEILRSGAVAQDRALSALGSGVTDPVGAVRVRRVPLDPGDGVIAQLSGHYRAYTPWCPHYEVGVSREPGTEGQLVLRAYSGVEASTVDVPLVALADDEGGGALAFAVGDAHGAPERARFSEVIDGLAQLLDIDGCVYSRVVPR